MAYAERTVQRFVPLTSLAGPVKSTSESYTSCLFCLSTCLLHMALRIMLTVPWIKKEDGT